MGRFLGACGASGPLELEVLDESDVSVGRWSLSQPFVVVGRDPKADVTLSDEQVSVRHAYFQILDGRVFWVDLGSRVGVTWQGVTLPCGWLPPGGSIGIGPHRLRLAGPSLGDAVESWPNPLAVNRLVPSDRLSKVTLGFPDVTPGPVSWPPRRVLTLIGRSTRCQLKIPDETVSLFHCALLRTSQGVWVVDLLSRDGTRLNGALVRWGRLSDGDLLRISRYRMRVQYDEGSNPSEADLPALDRSIRGPSGEGLALPPLPLERFPALFPGASVPADAPSPLPSVAGRSSVGLTALEPTIGPILAEFGQMQRQMFDQFQQAMMMMFQMFGKMHQEQIGLVREELDRIRQLNQEIQELKTLLGSGTERARPASPAGRAVPHGPRLTKPTATGAASERPAPSRPGTNVPPPAAAKGPSSRAPIMDERAENVHDLLFKRMTELQDERQNRWQKLLSMVAGGAET
jgi:pSer/pThr/pTyr-binding forkhead associated (FHA) protein